VKALPLALLLAGCTTVPVVTRQPEPPDVTQCRQGRTDTAPPAPRDWLRDGPAWAIAVLAILQDERQLRAREHGCVDRMKGEGIVR